MDNEDDKIPFIPLAGLYTNPENQPPPSISPPPYDSSSAPTAPYPVDAFTSEANQEQQDSQSNNKNVQNGGFEFRLFRFY